MKQKRLPSEVRSVMMRPELLIVLLVAIAIPISPAFGKGHPPPPTDLPVTTIFNSTDLSGAVADIQSDSLGAYFNNVDADVSILTVNGYNGIVWGDWQFGTLDSTVRKISVGFANPIQVADGGTANPNPPFTTKNVIGHAEVKCTQLGFSMISMSAQQTFQCPMIVRFFDSNGDDFRIYMAPNWTQPKTPETSYVQVTCNSVATDNSGCSNWFVDPIPAGFDGSGNPIPGTATGRLWGPPITGKGNNATGNQGDYHFRFHVQVTRP